MNYCKCGCGTPISDHATWKCGHWARGKEAYAILSDNGKKTGGWNKGIPRTEKEKEKMRECISPAERKRRSVLTKARWDAGVYDFMNGSTNPSCNPEVGKKIAAANRKRKVLNSTKEKIRNAKLGKAGPPISEANKAMASKRMKINNPMFREEVLKNHPVLKSGPKFHSLGEKKVGALLEEMNLPYSYQYQFPKARGFYTADFFLPQFGIIIEFDGHHSHVTQADKDRKRDAYIRLKFGFATLRLLPPTLNNRNIKNTKTLIREFINENKK